MRAAYSHDICGTEDVQDVPHQESGAHAHMKAEIVQSIHRAVYSLIPMTMVGIAEGTEQYVGSSKQFPQRLKSRNKLIRKLTMKQSYLVYA